MILLRELLEAKVKTTDFSAISKQSGKLVYFDTKDNMNTAVGAGTHDSPKIKGKDVETPKSSDLFKGDYETERGGTIDDTNGTADEILNGIKNESGLSYISLDRKNKNGKIVPFNFTSKDITTEMIKATTNKYGIDLNLISKLGADFEIKNGNGVRKEAVSSLIKSLILSDLESKNSAPDSLSPSAGAHKRYLDECEKTANLIKTGIDPERVKNQADKAVDAKKAAAAKRQADAEIAYKEKDVEVITKAFEKVKHKMVWQPTIYPYHVKMVANKFRIDVNRVLEHPEIYFELVGNVSDAELKNDGYNNQLEFVLARLGETIDSGIQNDTDAMSYLSTFQMAYPLENKNLSNDEWVKKIENEKENPTTVANGLLKFLKTEKYNIDNVDKQSSTNSKNQSDWVNAQAKKNTNYIKDMFSYQAMISKDALNRIDGMLKADPPPPIKANALYRGMAMNGKDYDKFMKSFTEGNTVNLPISSFSLDAQIATEFSNNVNNANATINKANKQSILIKVVNSKNTFNGFAMNANIGNVSAQTKDSMVGDNFANWSDQHEVLLPSNNKYKVIKQEVKEMEKGRSVTTITLEQTGINNEIKLKEFIDDNEKDILKKHLQYPNRTSLLYTKEGEN